MAKAREVLRYLRPDGGYSIRGEDFDTVRFDDWVEPVTREEFEAAFELTDAWLAEQETQEIAKREAALSKLTALGLTQEDLKALGL
jgi:hypothetical protein